MKRHTAFVTILLALALCASASAKEASQCAKISDDDTRLECFDLLFRKEVGSPSSAPANWTVRIETSKIDDSTNAFVYTEALKPYMDKFGRAYRPTLFLACRENKTSFWIVFEDHMSDHGGYGQVTFRIDKDEAFKQRMRESTDNRALGLWSGSEAIPFAKRLFGAQRLLARATPYGESAITVEFDVVGFEKATSDLRKACNW